MPIRFAVLAFALSVPALAVDIENAPGVVRILVGDQLIAEYHYDDPQIPRPFFANLHAPNGELITRPYPADSDADHADMHPGLWLSFGDINGADFWRNKAKTRHAGFVEQPHATGNGARFTAMHVYESSDGTIVCEETFHFEIRVTDRGYTFVWDSIFRSPQPFTFGDQEEMGLGFRVKPALSVEFGTGAITNDRGETNGEEIWGKTAAWCDYSGTTSDGARIGITLIPHPDNFAPSWMHARDYGLLVANPFGRNAMTGGAKLSTTVHPGESFRLRFGLNVHTGEALLPPDLE